MNSGKATLVFDMSDPDQKYEHKVMLEGGDRKSAMNDIFQYLRTRRKHNPPKGKEANDLLEEIWDMYHEVRDDYNLTLE